MDMESIIWLSNTASSSGASYPNSEKRPVPAGSIRGFILLGLLYSSSHFILNFVFRSRTLMDQC